TLSLHHFSLLVLPPHPVSPLFPYTTLFRSAAAPAPSACSIHPAKAACSLRLPYRPPAASGRSSFAGFAAGTAARRWWSVRKAERSEEHTSELQSLRHLVCRLLLEKKNKNN